MLASKIQITIKSEGYHHKPYPRQLHGLCYGLAGEDFVREKIPVFHPIIKDWKANSYGTNGVLIISNVSDHFSACVLKGLSETETLRLGSVTYEITSYEIIQTKILPVKTYDAKPVPDEIWITFNTPTVFRSSNRTLGDHQTFAYPDLKQFLLSISNQLLWLKNKTQPYAPFKEIERILSKVHIVDITNHPVAAKLEHKDNRPLSTFIGNMHLLCHDLDEDDKKILGYLLTWGKWLGVGWKSGYGFGNLTVLKSQTA